MRIILRKETTGMSSFCTLYLLKCNNTKSRASDRCTIPHPPRARFSKFPLTSIHTYNLAFNIPFS